MNRTSVWNLDPARYERHELHGERGAWPEKNCYIDVWIEVLHAAGLEPLAMLPFTLASDFDGDQWTFFKPAHSDIAELYGLLVQELNVYKPILEHCLHHLAAGRLVFSEADAYFLPDTRGTDYRAQHTKSTIVVESIDLEQRVLRYFHNTGYFQLEGDDFVQLFRVGAAPDPAFMPLFAELVKVDRARALPLAELVEKSKLLLATWFPRRPAQNPIPRFEREFMATLEKLKLRGLADYHAYAFATLRQCGAGFELLADYLRWLGRHDRGEYAEAAEHFDALSNGSKALILKGARAVNTKRTADFSETFSAMTLGWDTGMAMLANLVDAPLPSRTDWE